MWKRSGGIGCWVAGVGVAVLVAGGGCARRERTTLNVVMNLSEEEWAVMREQVLPAFERQHGLTVRAYQVPAGQLATRLDALQQAGRSEIDLFAQDNMSLSALVNRGLALDLTDHAAAIPEAVGAHMTEAGRFDGRLYFMPFRPNVQITYYNTEAFARHALEPPRTWEELLETARVFAEADGVGRVVFKGYGGAPTATQLYEVILQAGGDPLTLDDAGCVRAFRFLQELAPYLSPESARAKWDTANEIMARRDGYLVQNWPFGVAILLREYGLDFIDTYGGWAGPAGRAHVIGGDVLGIPVNATFVDEALALIRYLQSREVQETLVAELGWPSIREDAYARVADWQQPHFEAVQDALRHGVFRENVPWWPAWQRAAVRAYQEIVVNGAAVEATLGRLKGELEADKGRY